MNSCGIFTFYFISIQYNVQVVGGGDGRYGTVFQLCTFFFLIPGISFLRFCPTYSSDPRSRYKMPIGKTILRKHHLVTHTTSPGSLNQKLHALLWIMTVPSLHLLIHPALHFSVASTIPPNPHDRGKTPHFFLTRNLWRQQPTRRRKICNIHEARHGVRGYINAVGTPIQGGHM